MLDWLDLSNQIWLYSGLSDMTHVYGNAGVCRKLSEEGLGSEHILVSEAQ